MRMHQPTGRFVNALAACLVAALISATLIACGRPASQASQNAAETKGTAIVIKGSDTMVHLVSDWTETYMKAHPDQMLSVTGGGSGTGIAALINGTTDICASSREIKPEESAKAEKNGRKIADRKVAYDGIAIIVNENNPVKELTLEQLKRIYTGAAKRWSEVGGPDEPIQVISRESSSGTYAFFQEHVLQNEDYAPDAQLLPATATIVQTVSSDPWSIGYVGLGYAEGAKSGVKTVGVKKDDASPAVSPNVETVMSGAYGISRALYFYVTDPPSTAIQAFVDFCVSAPGQEIVKTAGYVPLGQ